MKYNYLLCIAFFLSCIVMSCDTAQKNEDSNSGVQVTVPQDVSPKELYDMLVNNPAFEDNPHGEAFAWHACNGGNLFVKAYKAWHDTSWLNMGLKYYDFLFQHMSAAPDGYIALIGKNFRNKGRYWSNEEVSDALAMNIMLEFSELVLNDPQLKAIYGEKAQEFVDFTKKHVVEKWDKRGLWIEIGEYGDYIFGNRFINPKDPSKWIGDTVPPFTGMSQKFNIANKLGMTNLYLYRITKDKFYRDKAEKLFYRLKSNFQYFDDHYVWHYWIPFYEGDIFYDENKLIHWSAVHPFRSGYQAEEVHQIVEAYHSGVVFSDIDIQRIINTNLNVMWNKDTLNPIFINSNQAKPDTVGLAAFKKGHNSGNKLTNMGQFWSSLIDFNETARKLYEKKISNPSNVKAKIKYAYYYNVLKKETPGLHRKKVVDENDVKVKNVPFGNSPDITIATVIPYIIKKGEDAFVVTKSNTPKEGELEIALFTLDGKEKLQTLYTGKLTGDPDGQKGLHLMKWDGTDSENKNNYSGKYLIRWTLFGKHRDYEVEIKE